VVACGDFSGMVSHGLFLTQALLTIAASRDCKKVTLTFFVCVRGSGSYKSGM